MTPRPNGTSRLAAGVGLARRPSRAAGQARLACGLPALDGDSGVRGRPLRAGRVLGVSSAQQSLGQPAKLVLILGTGLRRCQTSSRPPQRVFWTTSGRAGLRHRTDRSCWASPSMVLQGPAGTAPFRDGFPSQACAASRVAVREVLQARRAGSHIQRFRDGEEAPGSLNRSLDFRGFCPQPCNRQTRGVCALCRTR